MMAVFFRRMIGLLLLVGAAAAYAQSDPNEPPPPRAAPRGIVSEESLPRAGGVIVFGGLTGVGLEAVKQLVKDGEKVSVVALTGADTSALKALGVNVVTGDVLSPEQMKTAFTAAPFRVVLSAIDGRDGEWKVDVDGNRNVAAAAKAAGIPRMVMMSATGAAGTRGALPWYIRPFRGDFLAAKTAAEADLESAGLAYTIVRVGWLVDKPPSGKAVLTHDAPTFSFLSRADAGRLLADAAKQDSTANQVLTAVDPTRTTLWSMLF
jgi:uncharacterized protein YbjT (DUF2867 family)